MREAGRPRALKNTLTFLGFRGTSPGFLFRSGAIVPKVLSKAFSASFGALIARPDCFYFDFSVAEQMERTQDHTPKRMVENHLTSPLFPFLPEQLAVERTGVDRLNNRVHLDVRSALQTETEKQSINLLAMRTSHANCPRR